jgi:hypothetical protein
MVHAMSLVRPDPKWLPLHKGILESMGEDRLLQLCAEILDVRLRSLWSTMQTA